jgi:hypothetical protein
MTDISPFDIEVGGGTVGGATVAAGAASKSGAEGYGGCMMAFQGVGFTWNIKTSLPS